MVTKGSTWWQRRVHGDKGGYMVTKGSTWWQRGVHGDKGEYMVKIWSTCRESTFSLEMYPCQWIISSNFQCQLFSTVQFKICTYPSKVYCSVKQNKIQLIKVLHDVYSACRCFRRCNLNYFGLNLLYTGFKSRSSVT